MNRIINTLIVCAVLFCGACNVSNEQETSQWRGENRDGFYANEELADTWPEEGPNVLWQFDSLGTGYSSVALFNNTIYTMGTIDSANYLYAFSKSGELIYKKNFGPAWMKTYPGIRPTPLFHKNKGYFIDGLGVMHCFNPNDGELLWRRELQKEYNADFPQHGFHENLVIEGNKLFCTLGGKEANVLALDIDSGETIWQHEGIGEKNTYGSPKVINHNGINYLITITPKAIYSFNTETGELAWLEPIVKEGYGIHANVPLYKEGMLLIIEGYGYGARMFKLADDGMSVDQVWQSDTLDVQMGDAVLVGDDIIGTSIIGKQLLSVDWYTGKTKFFTHDYTVGTVIYADNKIYLQTYRGEMVMLTYDEQGFTTVGSFKTRTKGQHMTQPVIDDGILYLRHMNHITAYDIKK